jgi:hypothetical protein
MRDIIPILPQHVQIQALQLTDNALDQTYPMNATAMAFLSLVNGQRDLTDISQTLAQSYQQAPEKVYEDMTALCRRLERHYLLNLYEGWFQTLQRWIFCLFNILPPRLRTWRYDIPATTSYAKILFYLYGIVLQMFMPFFVFLACIITVFGLIVGYVGLFLGCYVVVCATLILGIALHEASHLWATRWFRGDHCGFVVSTGLSIRVIRPQETDTRREMIVSLLGPLTPTILAVCLIVFHLFVPFWVNWVFISIFGIHALQLILPNPDLGNIVRVIRRHTSRVQE